MNSDLHLIAAAADAWPDVVDKAALTLYLAIAFGAPALGLAIMVVDVRRYLHSLRRALVVVASAMSRDAPEWVLRRRPTCLQALDLDLPCSEQEVLAAYRARVKQLHPDHGGDLHQFLRLQKHFEQALRLARTCKMDTVHE